MAGQEEQRLYQDIKKKLCRMIYEDVYPDGSRIPPERTLAEALGVIRVTVSKALRLMEEDRIIERVQGSGTRVSLQYNARKGNLDIVTMVAPAQNSFFSRFIDAVQTTADKRHSLVLFKQKPKNLSLDMSLYQIYEKDLRNVILWQEDMEISQETLRKLRGLGMDFVLFDTDLTTPYADAVCLDNTDGIRQLVSSLKKQGCLQLGFVGWDERRVRSVCAREDSFRTLEKKGNIFRMPWAYRHHPEDLPEQTIDDALLSMKDCDGIVFSVSELCLPCMHRARVTDQSCKAAMIDVYPGWEELAITTLKQNFSAMAEKIFICLERQNQESEPWEAAVYQVKGNLKQM